MELCFSICSLQLKLIAHGLLNVGQVDILNVLNEEFGTDYELATPWHEVLAHQLGPLDEAEAQPAGTAGPGSGVIADLLHGQEWPESDPEDSDFRYVLQLFLGQGCGRSSFSPAAHLSGVS